MDLSVYANEDLPAFTCSFTDGSWYSGSQLSNWNKPDREPTLDGKKLFDTKKQIVWIKNNHIERQADPISYLEFYGGDILPGRVVDQVLLGGRNESALVVLPSFSFSLPSSDQKNIRVKESWVKRIVSDSGQGYSRLETNTIRTRKGDNSKFRSLRWQEGGVEALTESGLKRVELDDLSEIHYSPKDPWEVYIDLLAGLAPGDQERIFQIVTSTGLRLTSSTDRFLPESRGGNSNEENNWFHLVQPTWSLDPIWVRHVEIYKRNYFEPNQPPLSYFEAESVHYRHPLGTIFPYKIDKNVLGGVLQSKNQDYGWGLGVHAETSITYSFPKEVVAFQSGFTLDPVVGNGGCVQVLILDGLGKKLYQSPILVGSQTSYSTGWIQFPASRATKKLTLVCDAVAEENRPSGADPLDIRDHLNWLEPTVKLDPYLLKKKIRSRLENFVPAWKGWDLSGSKGYSFEPINFLDRYNYKAPLFRQSVYPRLPFLRLERSIFVKDENSRIQIFVGKPSRSYWNIKLLVQVNNEKPTVLTVPSWGIPDRVKPLNVPLGTYAGKDVKVKITQLDKGPTARIHWNDIRIH